MAPTKPQQQRAGEVRQRRQAPKKSLFPRPLDKLYLAFFIIHVPVMLCKYPPSLAVVAVSYDTLSLWGEKRMNTDTSELERNTYILNLIGVDLVPLYPEFMRPDVFLSIRHWYTAVYADKNFTEPTAWFTAYMWMEALYHLPLSIWAIGALIKSMSSFVYLF